MAILRKNKQGYEDKLHSYVILLGGNLGDVRGTFKQVAGELEVLGVVKESSSVYLTEAWGMDNVPDFYNQVVRVESLVKPMDMMGELLRIENKMGRVRDNSPNYISRAIDLDILFADQLVIHTEDLQIPHPRIQERRFVLEPLVEIMPEFIHPVLRKSMSELKTASTDNLRVKRL